MNGRTDGRTDGWMDGWSVSLQRLFYFSKIYLVHSGCVEEFV